MVQLISVSDCEQREHEVQEIPRTLAHPRPANFAHVSEGIYRSACPSKLHHSFLSHLGIKSILHFLPEYPMENEKFTQDKGIVIFQFPTKSNREHRKIPQEIIYEALRAMMDPKNQPILIHCRQGKHRTGTVVGCYRKLQNWPLEEIFDEYRFYAGDKARVYDQHFIENFQVDQFVDAL
jgi:tyrosine-protein phosphatase SIW14